MRVIRTCRVLGIPTVAVYSEADRDRPPRARGRRGGRDRPGRGAALLPLDRGALLAAARETGADAIHPGYGFLSQNGDFADAVRDAGLAFVGPPGDVHRRMGDKKAARRLMAAAGVPVLPGYDGDDQADATLLAEARRIGFPLMLKPSRGGGGKGMRVVRARGGLPRALAASRREARAAFGDDAMVLERFVERPRHVEVQVLADAPRRRSCTWASASARSSGATRRSSRRRRAPPSPRAQREALCAAGVAAARAAGYVNAGTVEFLLSPDGSLLLPRDEHAAAGRAPGDRGGDRARPGAAAARGGGGPSPAARAGGRRARAGTPSSAGSTPRTRRTTTCRRRGACSTSRSPRGRASASTRGSTPGSRGHRPLRPAALEDRDLGPRPRRGDRADARGAAAHGGARRRHQPRPAARDRRAPGLRGGRAAHRLHRGAPRRSCTPSPARRRRRSPRVAAALRPGASAGARGRPPDGPRPLGEPRALAPGRSGADAPALRRASSSTSEVHEARGECRASVGGRRRCASPSSRRAPGVFVVREGARAATLPLRPRRRDASTSSGRASPTRSREEREGARAARRHDTGALEAPMPGRVARGQGRRRPARGEGRGAARRRGDEDGERAARAARRASCARCTSRPGDMVAPGRAAGGAMRVSAPAGRVTVVEVGPRDGLQNESAAALGRGPRRLLRPAGRRRACRSSRWGPSSRRSGSRRWPGPTRCCAACASRPACGSRCWCRTARASSGPARPARARSPSSRRPARRFNRRNTNASIDESLRALRRLRARGEARGAARARLRVDLRSAVPTRARSPRRGSWRSRCGWSSAGCDEVSIGDTIGVAVPTQVADVHGTARRSAVPPDRLAVHFHDTRGTALANVLAALAGGRERRRQLGRGPRGLPLRPGRVGQPGHRGPPVHAPRDGDRDRRRPRRGGRGLARARRAARPRRCRPATSRPAPPRREGRRS